MKAFGKALFLIPFLLLASPASAEKLTFDHRLYPPLKAVLDSGDQGMVLYDANNPRYLVSRIAITGKDATHWAEALEIIARTPMRDMKTAADWMAELRQKANPNCSYDAKVIAQDDNSITFERQVAACPDERAPFAIYRIVAGKKSLFMLSVLDKTAPGQAAKAQWLAMLASAHIE